MPTGQDSVQIDVNVQTSDAEQALQSLERLLGKTIDRSEGLEHALRSAGATLMASRGVYRDLAQSLESVAQEAGGAASRLDRMHASAATIGQSLAALGPEIGMVQQVVGAELDLARSLLDTAVAGEAHTRAIATLGPAYRLVEESTRGVVSAEEAMRAQQRLTESGLSVTGEQLAVITRRAREYAIATGTDTTQSLTRLTNALERGSNRALMAFGLHAQAGEDRAASLTRNVNEMAAAMAGTAPAAETLGETMSHVSRNVTEFGENLVSAAIILLRSDPNVRALGFAFNWLREQLGGANHALEDYIQSHGGAIAGGHNLAAAEDHVATSAANASSSLQTLKQDLAHLDSGFRQGETSAESFSRRLAAMGQRLVELRRQHEENARLAAAIQSHTGGATDDELAALGLGGGAHGHAGRGGQTEGRAEARAAAVQQERDLYQQRLAIAQRIGAEINDVVAMQGETEAHYLHRALAVQETNNRYREELNHKRLENEQRDAANREALRVQAGNDELRHREQLRVAARDFEDDLHRQTIAQREAGDAGLQLRKVFTENQAIAGTAAQNLARTTQSAFGTMTKAVSSHVMAMIQGRESLGVALKGMLSDTLASVAEEATVKALLFTAQGIADAVTPGLQAKAGGDFAAAAAYAAVAAAAGAGAALVGSIGGAGGGGPSRDTSGGSGAIAQAASATGPGDYGRGGGGNGTTVNMYFTGNLYSREHAEDEIVRSLNSAAQRGVRPRNWI